MRRFFLLAAIGCFLVSTHAAAQFTIGDNTQNMPAVNVPTTNVNLSSKPMSKRTRLDMIRLMTAEYAYARIPLPKGQKGLTLKANGPLEPNGAALNDVLLRFGIVAKPGQRVQLTSIEFKDNTIRIDLNGGAKKKEKWYQHIEAGGNGGMIPIARQAAPVDGGILVLTFDKFVPEMDVQQLHELLAPLFDFTVKSPTQAYADTLPPKTRAAVLEHRALVGMNHEMVMAAVGAPTHKDRETEDGVAYEDWIYGDPPGQVQFLRFVGDEVVRIETATPGQESVIRTAREVDLPIRSAEEKEAAARPTPTRPQAPPTLRRPDEQQADVDPMEQERRKLEHQRDDSTSNPYGVPEATPTANSPQ